MYPYQGGRIVDCNMQYCSSQRQAGCFDTSESGSASVLQLLKHTSLAGEDGSFSPTMLTQSESNWQAAKIARQILLKVRVTVYTRDSSAHSQNLCNATFRSRNQVDAAYLQMSEAFVF